MTMSSRTKRRQAGRQPGRLMDCRLGRLSLCMNVVWGLKSSRVGGLVADLMVA